MAQSSAFYGEVDATLRAELAQWSTHYWNRVDTGAKVKVGSFAFSNAALNNPLFNPLRGARPTLEQVKVLNSSDCDGLAALQPGWGDAAIAAAFREAMKDWKFSTDTTTNATGTAIHVALITAAPPEAGTTWTSQGNLIISEKLPLVTVSGQNEEPTIATGVSSATQAAIDKIILIGPIIAAASAGTTEAQALITGEESHATKFERGVQTLLADGGWNGTTWRVDAAFGVFGSLPLVGVMFEDALVLVDSVTGGVDGPFEGGTKLDARTLLASHPQYLASTPVKYWGVAGCAVGNVPSKCKVPCPTGTPAGQCIPAGFTPVGTPAAWSCVYTPATTPNSGGTCVCITEYRYKSATTPCPGSSWSPPLDPNQTANRCLIFEKYTCSGGGANCTVTGCTSPGTPSPAPPPANPGSNACITMPCVQEVWYWAQ
ncbi:MAG: hypothetical protein IT438_07580 [Phycisphaerales bacterium]|nr:hypothetical protein [Phycisphaerales bacterium]